MNRTLKHLAGLGTAVIALAAVSAAQTTEAGPALTLTATSANVTGAPDSIRINLLRWSTDAERDQLLAAWMLTDHPAGRGPGARGAAGANLNAGGGPGTAGAGARAGGRRGGRGGADAAPPPPRTPETSLAAALGKAPTLGYLWSSEVAGYAIRYAVRLPEPGGGEHIILLTERRLGAWNDQWKPTGAAADAGSPNAEFSLIELRLNAKGEGEGKISQNAMLSVDTSAKTMEMENYSAAPVVLKNVKRSKS
jgi:hypothetical protein